jgi:hypothetical protein
MASEGFSFVACALGEAGVILAEGIAVPDARTVTAPWFAAGGGLRVSWRATSLVALEAELDALASLRRDEFQFGPDAGPPTDSMTVPAFVAQASLGAVLGAAAR